MVKLGRWFGKGSAPVLGIDLGPTCVRVLEVGQQRTGLRIVRYAEAPLARDLITEGVIADSGRVADALRGALKASGSRLRDAAFALPSGSVMRKTLSLPAALSDDELEAQVEAEAAQILPFAAEDISLDFATIGPSSEAPGHIDLMLVAARRERIDERLAVAEAAGLRAVAVDIESECLIAALQSTDLLQEDGRPAALVQLVSQGARCHVLIDGHIVFERDWQMAPSRRSTGLAAQGGLLPDSDGLAELLSQELMRTRQLLSTSTPYAGLGRLHIIDADGLVDQHILERLCHQLEVQATVPDLLASCEVSSAASNRLTPEQARGCWVALGLALQGGGR